MVKPVNRLWGLTVLKQRLLTAAVLIPIFIAVLFLPNQYFALFICLIVMLGAVEWTKLSGFDSTTVTYSYTLLLTSLCLLLLYFVSLNNKLLLIQTTLLWWVVALALILGACNA